MIEDFGLHATIVTVLQACLVAGSRVKTLAHSARFIVKSTSISERRQISFGRSAISAHESSATLCDWKNRRDWKPTTLNTYRQKTRGDSPDPPHRGLNGSFKNLLRKRGDEGKKFKHFLPFHVCISFWHDASDYWKLATAGWTEHRNERAPKFIALKYYVVWFDQNSNLVYWKNDCNGLDV